MTKKIKWTIDPVHSEIAFKIKHLMITNVKGAFKKFDASVYTTDKDFTTADIDVWIDSASIDTGDKKRDEHLKGKDFFDVVNHKQITFIATAIEKSTKDTFELWGNLTIRGITKQIKLNIEFGGIVKDTRGKEKAGFTITGKINRKDWGLNWNTALEAGGFLLSDEVIIDSEVELVNASITEEVMELEATEDKEAVTV